MNSSPLIILTRAEILDFLRLMGDPILVPFVVAQEIAAYGKDDVTVRAIAETDWLVVVDALQSPSSLRRLRLGAGETATLTWAMAHPGTIAILDDAAACQGALSLGIPVVGTLGLILAAKEHGLIVEAAPTIERARHAGLYLPDQLVRVSLEQVGE